MAQDIAATPAYARAAEPQTAAAPQAAAAPPQAKRSPRRFVLPLIVIAAAAYGAHWGYGYFTEGRFLVSTDDAYVGADTVIVAPKVAGYITDVLIDNNQEVKSGDLLARIDAGDYDLALAAATDKVATQDATIARIDRQIEAQRALVTQSQAQIEAAAAAQISAAADEQRASLEFDRAQKLAQTSFGSQQRLEQATADKKRTAAAAAGAQATLASTQAQRVWNQANIEVLASQKVEAEHTRAELQTAVARARRDLAFTEIRAPFDGVIGNKAVEVGQYVQPGARLLAVVPLDNVYVDANFKETQLADIKPGQKADVSVDAFDGRAVPCVVRSVAPASGAQFSLLPPDNATGNFTKIVQRVTVRVGCEAEALRSHTLRPGLSVVATIHTRDESLPKPTLIGALGLGKSRP
ncbi:MAG: HlyD family secretion protein [Pseudomonadota bacterium]|nr:HlyD family secretion protein [Pseudomonadota bacterium]